MINRRIDRLQILSIKQFNMVFPPTRAAYEALINEVKLLKEENKQLRNEIKETSRSTLEVELETETRDRKASRNSWAEIYHNNTVRRKRL